MRILNPESSPLEPEILLEHRIDGAVEEDNIVLLSVAGATLTAFTSTGKAAFVELSTGAVSAAAFPGPVSAVAVTPEVNAVIIGGLEHELEVFAKQPSGEWTGAWKAKNVKPTALKLAVPIYPTRALFLPAAAADAWRILVGTKYGHLRIYDTAISRRPVWSYDIPGKRPIVQLAIHPASLLPTADASLVTKSGEEPNKTQLRTDLQVVLTDDVGWFGVYSLGERRQIGVYKGATGAVLGVDTHADIIAGTGFDRYVFAYDPESRELLSRAYVKTQGLCVAVVDAEDEVVEKPEEVEKSDEEEVWEGMEEVSASDGGEEGESAEEDNGDEESAEEDDEDEDEGGDEEKDEGEGEGEDEGEGDMTQKLVSTKRKPRPRPTKDGGDTTGKRRRMI